MPSTVSVKLDCEQAEYAVIRTAPLSVLRKFRSIIVEFHPEPGGETLGAAYVKLTEAGFHSPRTLPGELRFTDIFIRSGSIRIISTGKIRRFFLACIAARR